jgi:hypothetical protein
MVAAREGGAFGEGVVKAEAEAAGVMKAEAEAVKEGEEEKGLQL